MPRIHEMIESKFLKKEDAGEGITATIVGVEKRDVGTESEPEQKWVLLMKEFKPLVLNSTNLALLEKSLGSDNSDDWAGKYVVLFNDENVSFAGKLTGGVRVDVRQTKEANAQARPQRDMGRGQPAPDRGHQQAPPPKRGRIEDMEDDIPFR
jgi:hypothetical protein